MNSHISYPFHYSICSSTRIRCSFIVRSRIHLKLRPLPHKVAQTKYIIQDVLQTCSCRNCRHVHWRQRHGRHGPHCVSQISSPSFVESMMRRRLLAACFRPCIMPQLIGQAQLNFIAFVTDDFSPTHNPQPKTARPVPPSSVISRLPIRFPSLVRRLPLSS